MDSLALCFPRVSQGFQGTPVHCFPLSSINRGAHAGLPTFLLIKMAVIPDYCNGPWFSVHGYFHLCIHPSILPLARSLQDRSSHKPQYLMRCGGGAELWSFLLAVPHNVPWRSDTHQPESKLGWDSILSYKDKVEFRGKKRLGGRGHLWAGLKDS